MGKVLPGQILLHSLWSLISFEQHLFSFSLVVGSTVDFSTRADTWPIG